MTGSWSRLAAAPGLQSRDASIDCEDECKNHRKVIQGVNVGDSASRSLEEFFLSLNLAGTVTGNAPKFLHPFLSALFPHRAAMPVCCSHRGRPHRKGHAAGWLKSAANLCESVSVSLS